MENSEVKKSEMKVKKVVKKTTKNLNLFTKEIKELYNLKIVNGNFSFEGTFMMYLQSQKITKITNHKNVIEIETYKMNLVIFKTFEKVIIVIYD